MDIKESINIRIGIAAYLVEYRLKPKKGVSMDLVMKFLIFIEDNKLTHTECTKLFLLRKFLI